MDGSKFRTACIVTALLTLSLISAIPTAAAEGNDSISWGVEYEWENLNKPICYSGQLGVTLSEKCMLFGGIILCKFSQSLAKKIPK